MKKATLITLLLFACITVFGQNKTTYNQYMINPGTFNPGYIDIFSETGFSAAYRKQWLKQGGAPESIFANGYYNISRNHGIGFTVSNDVVNKFNQMEAGANYVYHIWIKEKIAIGFGVKANFYQQSINRDNFVYFDAGDTTLSGGLKQTGVNFGTGMSVTTRNFDLNIGLPSIFANYMANPKYDFDVKKNHLYASAGYKFRVNESFIFYPTAFLKGVSGGPAQGSLDANFLINQTIWAGVGYKTSKSVVGTFGIYFENGLKIVYNVESMPFSDFTSAGFSHEISIGYSKPFAEGPFSNRKYIKKGGKLKQYW